MVFTPKRSVFYFALFAAFALAFVTHAETTENVEGTLISSESSGYGRKLMASTEDEVSEEEISNSANWRLRIKKAQYYVRHVERAVISSRRSTIKAMRAMRNAKIALGMRVRNLNRKRQVRKPKRKPYQPRKPRGSPAYLARIARMKERRARSVERRARIYKKRVAIAITRARLARKRYISTRKAKNMAFGELRNSTKEARKLFAEYRSARSDFLKATTAKEKIEARNVMRKKYKIARASAFKIKRLRMKYRSKLAYLKRAARGSRMARRRVQSTKRLAYLWSRRAISARRIANAAALAAKKAQTAANPTATTSSNSTNSTTSL